MHHFITYNPFQGSSKHFPVGRDSRKFIMLLLISLFSQCVWLVMMVVAALRAHAGRPKCLHCANFRFFCSWCRRSTVDVAVADGARAWNLIKLIVPFPFTLCKLNSALFLHIHKEGGGRTRSGCQGSAGYMQIFAFCTCHMCKVLSPGFPHTPQRRLTSGRGRKSCCICKLVSRWFDWFHDINTRGQDRKGRKGQCVFMAIRSRFPPCQGGVWCFYR